MNARIINLRTQRKQKARAEKQAKAAQRIKEASVDRSDRTNAARNEAQRITRLEAHKADTDAAD